MTEPTEAPTAAPAPPPYSSAVVVRVYPDERQALNAEARAAGLTLQNFCRARLGLPLPENPKSPYTFDPIRAQVRRAKRRQSRRV
ncbi:MAG: plasmid mobilization protein [Aureliella sp.]